MDAFNKISRWTLRQRNRFVLLGCLLFASAAHSQTLFLTSDEVGISKIDSSGIMSDIAWTKSKVAVLMNTNKYSVHVFLTNASLSQVYNEVTLLKKVETADDYIRTYSAVNLEGSECILVLVRNKSDGKAGQLRIYLNDKVYIFNFAKN